MTDSLDDLRRRGRLSALWTFVTLNLLFRDVHEVFEPGVLADLAGGALGGSPLAPWLALAGGAVVEIPVAMVVLSRVLPWGALRAATSVAAALGVTALAASSAVWDPDDAFFAAMQGLGHAAILWTALSPLPAPRPGLRLRAASRVGAAEV